MANKKIAKREKNLVVRMFKEEYDALKKTAQTKNYDNLSAFVRSIPELFSSLKKKAEESKNLMKEAQLKLDLLMKKKLDGEKEKLKNLKTPSIKQ